MPRTRALVRSPFLVRVPRADGDAVVFHSLYGTRLVLNPAAEAVLDLFATPTSLAAARVAARGDVRAVVDGLLARRFLVEPGADERGELGRRMRPEPPGTGAHLRDLVLLAAEPCNLACPYCIKDHLMGLRPERRQARMAGATARAAIEAFLAVAERAGQRDLGLQFRGGEALLGPAVLFDAVRHMRARWKHGAVHASMVSNATLVTAAIARTLAELQVSVEVSLDGPRAVHDSVRVTRNGRPTYDRVVAGLGRLLDAGVAVPNLNVTVTAGTLPALDAAFLADVGGLGVRRLNVEPDVLRPAHPDPQALASHLLALREAGRARGVEVSGCWSRALRALDAVAAGAPLPPPADYPLLVVDALGQVVPWEYNGVAELGPVTDLPHVLASDAYARHAESRTPGRIPECVGCEVEGLCQGNASITLLYERATGKRGLFAHRCELIRAMTRGVLATAPVVDAPPGPSGRGVPAGERLAKGRRANEPISKY